MPKKEIREVEKKEESVVVPEPIEENNVEVEFEVKEEKEVKETDEARKKRTAQERAVHDREESLATWKPKTEIGQLVKDGKITNIEEVFKSGKKILESQLVDMLIPNLQMDLLTIGQAKGKFGGGKRRFWRQTQRKTAQANVPSFSCLVVVGDGAGHVGIGLGKASETLPAKEKAIRQAKLNLISVKRGCGSFDCSCSDLHSIPYLTEGKTGSAIVKLMPASKGTGLVIDAECKKIMKAAGIKDVYSRTFGQTRTKINLAEACFGALKNLSRMKTQ